VFENLGKDVLIKSKYMYLHTFTASNASSQHPVRVAFCKAFRKMIMPVPSALPPRTHYRLLATVFRVPVFASLIVESLVESVSVIAFDLLYLVEP
jgi:hypothetical protein